MHHCCRLRSYATAAILFLELLSGGSIARAQREPALTFVAIGDGGQPGPINDAVARMAAQVVSSAPSRGERVGMFLFLGDNFYPIGLNQPEEIRDQLIRD